MAVAVSRRPLDVAAVLARVASPRDAAIFALMGHAGVSPGEVRLLDVDDVGLEAGRLFVHGRHGGNRCLALCEAVRPYLETWLAVRPVSDGRELFASGQGGRLSARTIRGLAERAGVRAFDLRHAYVRDALAQGKDPRHLRGELGLQSIDAVLRSVEPRPVRRSSWRSAALRRWTLETLEAQLEAWHLRSLHQIPPTFRWPPLPPEDLARIEAASPSIKKVIDVIIDDLLDRPPRPCRRPQQHA